MHDETKTKDKGGKASTTGRTNGKLYFGLDFVVPNLT